MSSDPLYVRRARVVSIPVDVLWQLIEPVETLPSWFPLAERAERVSGEGLGRVQRVTARWGRRTAEIDQQVTAYEPERRIAWTHLAERVNGRPAPRISARVTTTIRLEAANPGTRVVLESEHVPSGALAALVLKFVAKPRLEKAFDRALANLAAAGG